MLTSADGLAAAGGFFPAGRAEAEDTDEPADDVLLVFIVVDVGRLTFGEDEDSLEPEEVFGIRGDTLLPDDDDDDVVVVPDAVLPLGTLLTEAAVVRGEDELVVFVADALAAAGDFDVLDLLLALDTDVPGALLVVALEVFDAALVVFAAAADAMTVDGEAFDWGSDFDCTFGSSALGVGVAAGMGSSALEEIVLSSTGEDTGVTSSPSPLASPRGSGSRMA